MRYRLSVMLQITYERKGFFEKLWCYRPDSIYVFICIMAGYINIFCVRFTGSSILRTSMALGVALLKLILFPNFAQSKLNLSTHTHPTFLENYKHERREY
jgi:hypothetical protein